MTQDSTDETRATRAVLEAAGLMPTSIGPLPDPDVLFERSKAIAAARTTERAGVDTVPAACRRAAAKRPDTTGCEPRRRRSVFRVETGAMGQVGDGTRPGTRPGYRDPRPGARPSRPRETESHGRGPRHANRRRSRHALRAVAIAVLAVVVVVVTPSAILPNDSSAYAAPLAYSNVKQSGQWHGSPGIEPTSTLSELADAAQERTESSQAGAVQHTTSFRWTRSSFDGKPGSVFEARWLDPDGRLTLSSVREPATVNPSGTSVNLDESAYAGRPAVTITGSANRMAVDPKLFTAQAAQALSPGADTLLAQLSDPSTCPTSWMSTTFCLADRYLRMYELFAVPGSVDASMWRALEKAGGTRDLGTVTDRTGRRGVGISVPEQDTGRGGSTTLLTLIADPETGRLLGVEWIAADGPGGKAPASVTSFEYFGASSWVKQTPTFE